jgi:hypothetical protein
MLIDSADIILKKSCIYLTLLYNIHYKQVLM